MKSTGKKLLERAVEAYKRDKTVDKLYDIYSLQYDISGASQAKRGVEPDEEKMTLAEFETDISMYVEDARERGEFKGSIDLAKTMAKDQVYKISSWQAKTQVENLLKANPTLTKGQVYRELRTGEWYDFIEEAREEYKKQGLSATNIALRISHEFYGSPYAEE